MAAFAEDSSWTHPFDFALVRHGPVTLFHAPQVLAATVQQLRGAGYDVVVLDTAVWTDEATAHRELAAALEFPSYYGENLAAFGDCLSDVVTYDYGTTREATGFVLVLEHLDGLRARLRDLADGLVENFAFQAWEGALIGHRMLCLVQSDDPDLHLPSLTLDATWNPAEWRTADRVPTEPR